MIFGQGRFLRNLTHLGTYSAQSRPKVCQVAQNPDPAQKARIWPQMGVLQLPLHL